MLPRYGDLPSSAGAAARGLDRLQPDDWQRTGTLVGAGKPVSLTAHRYAERLARHERPHVKQIARVVTAVTG